MQLSEPRNAFLDSVITIIKASNAGMLARIAVLEAEIKELRAREPLVGPMGPAGPQGERGADGIDGRPGADSVVPGPEGPMGPRGERGTDGVNGKDGRDGKDAEPVDIDALAIKAAALIPKPKDGVDGKNAEVDEAMLARLMANHLASIPVPENGKDGQDGKSITLEDVAPLIQAEVAKAVERIPTPKDGIGLVGALIDRDGRLIVTMSDGTTKDVGIVVGPDPDPEMIKAAVTRELATWPRPKDGEPGKDGVLEALSVKKLDYRTLQFCHKDNGEPIEGGTVLLDNVPMYPDPSDPVFKKEREYRLCDLVNWGGKVYYAKVAGCGIVPGDGSAMSEMMWGLFSDRGRMGKTGLTGPQGAVGKQGERGERGPERW